MRSDKVYLQLLEVLAQNCRVSHASLGRTFRVSKDTIAYRVKKLEESELLKQYVLFVDARKLGFTRYHILIQFEDAPKLKDMYPEFAKHKFVMWINSFIGRFDIQIIVDALDGFHLNSIKEELFSICHHRIKHYSILTHLADLEFTQLNPILDFHTEIEKKADQSFTKELTTRNFPVLPDFRPIKIDYLDNEILDTLADDPKASLASISEKVGCERQTTKRHISGLIENGVILSFGGVPNLSKLGFVTYYLLVRLSQDTSYDRMKLPFQELNNIFYAGQMLGDYDMILYLNARNPQELNNSIQLFRQRLQGSILNYDLLVQDGVQHWRQFTKGIYQLKKEGLGVV
jgi:DNA-binding Lrp family transcriptional regulator